MENFPVGAGTDEIEDLAFLERGLGDGQFDERRTFGKMRKDGLLELTQVEPTEIDVTRKVQFYGRFNKLQIFQSFSFSFFFIFVKS